MYYEFFARVNCLLVDEAPTYDVDAPICAIQTYSGRRSSIWVAFSTRAKALLRIGIDSRKEQQTNLFTGKEAYGGEQVAVEVEGE